MAADQAAALLIVGSFILVFLIFREIKNDESELIYLKEAGYVFSMWIALAGLNAAIAFVSGTGGQQDLATQLIFRGYLFFTIAITMIIVFLVIWKGGRRWIKWVTEIPFRGRRR